MMIRTGTICYASDTSPEAVEEARAWITARKLTRADVRLVTREGQTLVIAERDLPDARG